MPLEIKVYYINLHLYNICIWVLWIVQIHFAWNWKLLQHLTKAANLHREGFVETFKHSTHMEVSPSFLFWRDLASSRISFSPPASTELIQILFPPLPCGMTRRRINDREQKSSCYLTDNSIRAKCVWINNSALQCLFKFWCGTQGVLLYFLPAGTSTFIQCGSVWTNIMITVRKEPLLSHTQHLHFICINFILASISF